MFLEYELCCFSHTEVVVVGGLGVVVVVVVVKGMLLDEEGAVLVYSRSAYSQYRMSKGDQQLQQSLRWLYLLVLSAVARAWSRSVQGQSCSKALKHTAGVLTTAAAVGDGELVVCHLHEPPHAVPGSIEIARQLTGPAVDVGGDNWTGYLSSVCNVCRSPTLDNCLRLKKHSTWRRAAGHDVGRHRLLKSGAGSIGNCGGYRYC
jgi:hypothetical protein